MQTIVESSDTALLDLLRQSRALGVSEMASSMQVTATAVRQRLARLMAGGLIQGEAAKAARGRPSHRYSLTEKGVRRTRLEFRRSGHRPLERGSADQRPKKRFAAG